MSSRFPTRSDTNRAVQPQKMARSLKLLKKLDCTVYVVKQRAGADQLRCYRTVDLHLCFHICKKQLSYDVALLIHQKSLIRIGKHTLSQEKIDTI